MDKEEALRAGIALAVVLIEWYAMQPYHEPVIARIWLFLARLAQTIARKAGQFGLHAEHNYYIAVEAGL